MIDKTLHVIPRDREGHFSMMGGDIASFEQQLTHMLEIAAANNMDHRISVPEIRKWTVEYLRHHAEEIELFPEIRDESHWNLFAKDAWGEDAVFVMVTFTSDQFGLMAGRADRAQVHEFGENSCGNAPAAIEEARKVCSWLSEFLEMPLSHALYWLECA